MSTYYLVDMHGTATTEAAIASSSRIVDVILTTSSTAEFRCDGLVPIKIPEGVRIDNPTSVADLLTQKYDGILAQFPGFTNMERDALIDTAGVQTAAPPTKMRKTGLRGTTGGTFRTTVATAALSVTQAILVYEHYTWRYVDSRDGRVERYYIEAGDGITAGLRVKAGSAFQATTSGTLVEFLVADQGTAVQVEFLVSNPVFHIDNRLIHTGSWAVIY